MSSDWKYHITVEYPDCDIIQLWCKTDIGEFGQDWCTLGIDITQYFITGIKQSTWYFKQEKHAILFKLKWS
jgi:hypothetical protein